VVEAIVERAEVQGSVLAELERLVRSLDQGLEATGRESISPASTVWGSAS
jgi:3-hydroxyacyl-CoA dehydrogenase